MCSCRHGQCMVARSADRHNLYIVGARRPVLLLALAASLLPAARARVRVAMARAAERAGAHHHRLGGAYHGRGGHSRELCARPVHVSEVIVPYIAVALALGRVVPGWPVMGTIAGRET